MKEKSEAAIKLSIILYCLLILIFLVLVKIGPKQDLVGFLNGKLLIIKNVEEKEKFFLSLKNREEKEELFLHFLKIERRTRHEN